MTIEISQEVIDRASLFSGSGHQLEAALGALVMGQLYGRRALLMLHSSRVLRRHEAILGLHFADVCPRETHLSSRVFGISLAEKLGGFWKVAEGQAAGRERFQLVDGDQGRLL